VLGAEEDAVQVDVDQLLPAVQRQFADVADDAEDACAVEGPVDRAELGDRRRDRRDLQ